MTEENTVPKLGEGMADGAKAAYHRAIQSGDPEPAARASEALERLTG